jgi:predicted transcriptional regulator
MELSNLMRAIGHPARIAILLAIVKKGNKVEGEIVPVEGLAPATVVQHLRELKRAGWIAGKLFGANCIYWVEPMAVEKLQFLFTGFMSELSVALKEK